MACLAVATHKINLKRNKRNTTTTTKNEMDSWTYMWLIFKSKKLEVKKRREEIKRRQETHVAQHTIYEKENIRKQSN